MNWRGSGTKNFIDCINAALALRCVDNHAAEDGEVNSRRWIPISVTIVSTAVLVAVAVVDWVNRERPIVDLTKGLHYVSPEKWYADQQRLRLYDTTGWVLLPQTPDSQPTIRDTTDPPGAEYLGPEACAECHQERYDGFQLTAHARTSRPVSREAIRGSFDEGENQLKTRDPRLHFVMREGEDGFYQKVVIERNERSYSHEQRIDIVTGSANHGQTFLYWMDDRLYELPVTYFTARDSWMNSPGYPDGTADFARPINARCLECHATYFEYVPGTQNQFVPEKSILGVTCERCHGPGEKHVSYHRDHPDATEARHVVHPALLPRDRLIEVCAQCHSGAGKARLKPPFTFRPGEVLTEYMILEQKRPERTGGVHTANQLGRLSLSRCFQESADLTCDTCHDPHKDEHARSELFTERCLKCHEIAQCKMAAGMGGGGSESCISCHMPLRQEKKVRLKGPESDRVPVIRDHFIRVFPEHGTSVERFEDNVRGREPLPRRGSVNSE